VRLFAKISYIILTKKDDTVKPTSSKHFAWSESTGGSPGGGSPNGTKLERAKSAETVKYSVGVPNLDEHFSSSARHEFHAICRIGLAHNN